MGCRVASEINPWIPYRRLAALWLAAAMLLIWDVGTARSADMPSWPHDSSDLAPSPEMTFGRLDNGLRYVLQHNPLPRGRVSMHLNVQVGALNETDEERGLAHFLEHLQFNGSTHFPPGELVKYFQRIGMEFGPDANAHTGFDETVYDILLPNNRLGDIREGLLVLSDYAQGALLLPEEVDRERRVILAEKRSRDSAAYRTFVRTLEFEFPGARLANRMPIGTVETIRRMDRKMIRDFYTSWYRPSLMVLVVVGDIPVLETQAAIEEIFGTLDPGAPERSSPGVGVFSHKGDRVFYHHEPEAGETAVRLEVVSPMPAQPDTSDVRRRQFTEDVADRIVQNRLDALLDKPDTPFTQAAIASGTFLKTVRYAEISASCAPGDWRPVLDVIEGALRQALTYGFTEVELERVRKDIVAELDLAVNQMATRRSQNIARGIIRAVNDGQVPLSPEQERSLYRPMIEGLTPETVSSAFRKTWDRGHRLIIVTGNAAVADDGGNAERIILDAYRAAAAQAVSPPAVRDVPAFPYLPVPAAPGGLAEQETISDLGVTRAVLDNGTQVLIKPTDFAADEIQVRVSFGPGRAGVPADTPGLGIFARDLINESGVGALTRDELDAAMAGNSLSASFAVNEDRFVFAGSSGNADLETLFQLLYTRLVDPALRTTSARLIKSRYAQRYAAEKASFRAAMRISGYRQLADGDPRFGTPPSAVYRERTIDEVARWLLPFFKRAPLEIVIVGDVDTAVALTLARRYFGTLAGRDGAAPAAIAPVRFPDGQRFETPVATRIDNSLLVVALPTADIWDISRTRRLSILAEIISERLRVDIREGLGATYSPFAANRASRAYDGYGTLLVFAEVAPADAERVGRAIRSMLADLAEGGVSEDLLRRALDPTLTGIRDMMRRNDYWTDTVLADASRHPEQLDWSRSIARDYAAITVDEINALARRYLVLPRAATLYFHPGGDE